MYICIGSGLIGFMFVSTHLPTYYPSVYLYTYIPIDVLRYLSIYPLTHLSVCLSICLSNSLWCPILSHRSWSYLTLSLFVCLSISIYPTLSYPIFSSPILSIISIDTHTHMYSCSREILGLHSARRYGGIGYRLWTNLGKRCLSFPPKKCSFQGPLSSESVSEFALEGPDVCEKLVMFEGVWTVIGTRKMFLLNQKMAGSSPNEFQRCSKKMSKRRSFRWKQTCGYRGYHQYTRESEGSVHNSCRGLSIDSTMLNLHYIWLHKINT